MFRYCPECGQHAQFHIVREYTDSCGRRWEVHQCAACGHKLRYAVT